MTEEDNLLTLRQVADRLGLREQTMRNWRTRGEGPPAIRVGRRAIRFRPADVETWLAARDVEQRPVA